MPPIEEPLNDEPAQDATSIGVSVSGTEQRNDVYSEETNSEQIPAQLSVQDPDQERSPIAELIDSIEATYAVSVSQRQHASRLTKLREQLAQTPEQTELPLAVVQGETVTKLPQDLYIPPDALEVFLDAFEGPLDLLLYLIKRQNLDILNIPIAEITSQYMQYVEIMKSMNLELAAEYLVMAALLGEIKSRSLLPRSESAEEDEQDPRAELIRRLQEYERFKRAAEDIDQLPRLGRDVFNVSAQAPDYKRAVQHPDVDLREVLHALKDVLHRADMFESHQVSREKLSTRERMTSVLERLSHQRFVAFESLFTVEEGRLGVVVTFLAVLELVKEQLIELVQTELRGPIHVRAKTSAAENGEPFEDEDLLEDAVD